MLSPTPLTAHSLPSSFALLPIALDLLISMFLFSLPFHVKRQRAVVAALGGFRARV